MKIGNKVRAISEPIEGIVIGIDGYTIEVETEDGFSIPFQKSDLVVVAKEEDEYFHGKPSSNSIDISEENTENQVQKLDRIPQLHIAFVPFNDKIYDQYIINDTDFDIPLAFGKVVNKVFSGLYTGCLESKSYIKTGKYDLIDLKDWPTFIVRSLVQPQGEYEMIEPIESKLKIQPKKIIAPHKAIPLINKEGLLFSLENTNLELDALEIKKSMLSKNTASATPDKTINPSSRPSPEIDLHIEKITKLHEIMDDKSKLNLQLEVFDKKLTDAIAHGLDYITFIHGVGTKKLQREIHKRLSTYCQEGKIKTFKDAQKEKYGYGATRVILN